MKNYDSISAPEDIPTKQYVDDKVSTGGPPSGPAGGDLTGTYPNPALAVDRVRRTGDTMSGDLTVSKTGGSTSLSVTSTAGTTAHNISAPASSSADLRLQTAGGQRWIIGKNQTPEGGGNAGSDLGIYRYNDSGGYLGAAATFSRATGLGTVAGDPTAPLGIATKQYTDAADALKVTKSGDTMTGDLSIAGGTGYPTLSINYPATAGNYGQLSFLRGGTLRWIHRVGGDTESGSNTGSDYQLINRNDAGAALGTPVLITRSTGEVHLQTDPTSADGAVNKRFLESRVAPAIQAVGPIYATTIPAGAPTLLAIASDESLGGMLIVGNRVRVPKYGLYFISAFVTVNNGATNERRFFEAEITGGPLNSPYPQLRSPFGYGESIGSVSGMAFLNANATIGFNIYSQVTACNTISSYNSYFMVRFLGYNYQGV